MCLDAYLRLIKKKSTFFLAHHVFERNPFFFLSLNDKSLRNTDFAMCVIYSYDVSEKKNNPPVAEPNLEFINTTEYCIFLYDILCYCHYIISIGSIMKT